MKTIERLKQLLAKATPGPWTDAGGMYIDGPDKQSVATACGCCDGCTGDNFEHDNPLIVESRNALPALLAVVEAQAEEIEAWRTAEEECRAIENACDMNAARAYIAKSRDNTDAALRALEWGE